MRSGLYRVLLWGVLFFAVPSWARAGVVVSEIMYNPTGADDTHEWIELYNGSSTSVDISKWRINDGKNHIFAVPPKKGGRGSLVIAPGRYIILAADAKTFITEHPSVGVAVIDTALSLINASGTITLLRGDGSVEDRVSYTKNMGAYNDGYSLQRVSMSSAWLTAGTPTPGTGTLSKDASVLSSSSTTVASVAPVPTAPTDIDRTQMGGASMTHVPQHRVFASHKSASVATQSDSIPTDPVSTSSQMATVAATGSKNSIKWWLSILGFALCVGGGVLVMRRMPEKEG